MPGRPVKDVAVPPPVPAERPTYKEKFIPPELSMWDYFVAKVGDDFSCISSILIYVRLKLAFGWMGASELQY